MIPVAGFGLWFAIKLWNARPVVKGSPMPHVEATNSAVSQPAKS
jgi:hypothetical protein